MKVLYQGIDTLDFAVKGALPAGALAELRELKAAAVRTQCAVAVTIGPGRVEFQLAETGRRGGYAFTGHTGPLGAVYAFKDNTDADQWNVFVSIRASALAALGYTKARDTILGQLTAMGCCIREISVARVDYAVDIQTKGFTLDPSRFVAHPHARLKPHYSVSSNETDFHPAPVFRGRRVESVTIGKMPGRQIIVYDKRYAALQKRELFWFDAWGVSPNDEGLEIWRVEIRAGKRELKDRWQVTTFEALDCMLGDIAREAMAAIRYHAAEQSDSNVSRQQLDLLWQTVSVAVARDLRYFSSGLTPSRLVELERAKAVAVYEAQVLGNLGGLAAAKGIAESDLEYDLPDLAARLVSNNLRQHRSSVRKSAERTRERLRFTENDRRLK